ncbi:hypothetical protein D3C80_2118030 [compost metagenome]
MYRKYYIRFISIEKGVSGQGGGAQRQKCPQQQDAAEETKLKVTIEGNKHLS